MAIAGSGRLRAAALALATFAAIVGLALAARFAARPGTDIEPHVQPIVGRAPRLDAYWYTRTAIDAARGEPPLDRRAGGAPEKFDRPIYTAFCRAVYAVFGATPATVALPAILAGALSAGLVFAVGRRGGFALGTAALAGIFAATSWVAVVHDREPLIYSTVTLLLLAGVLVWLGGFARPWLFGVGWAVIAATALAAKETVLLAAPALGLAQVAAADAAPRRKLALVGGLIAAGAVGAAAVWLLAPGLAGDFMGKITSRMVVEEALRPEALVATIGDLPRIVPLLSRIPAIGFLALAGAVAVALEGRAPAGDRAALFRRFLLFWLAIGCLLVSLFYYRPARYVLCLFPAAFLLAAHGAAVLAGFVPSPVRRGRRAAAAILFFGWWLGLSTLYWLCWLELSTSSAASWLPPLGGALHVRLAITAFAAALLAGWQAARVTAEARLPAREALIPPWCYALVATGFVFLSDGRGLAALGRPRQQDDLFARRSFEVVVGPGARVRGYAAHYLAFEPGRRALFDFELTPSDIRANDEGATHLATLWIGELRYVERLLAATGAPLHVVADVVIGRERYRIYRLPDAERRGYVLTPFEQARALEEAGKHEEAARAFRALCAGPQPDPIVLAYGGAAIARVAPEEGLALLARAIRAAPRYGPAHLFAAEALARQGRGAESSAARAQAAMLLPGEMVLPLAPATTAPRGGGAR